MPDGVLADGMFGVNVGKLLEDPLEEDPPDGVILGIEIVGVIGTKVVVGLGNDGGGVGVNDMVGIEDDGFMGTKPIGFLFLFPNIFYLLNFNYLRRDLVRLTLFVMRFLALLRRGFFLGAFFLPKTYQRPAKPPNRIKVLFC